jgi:ribosomal protein L11 methyltransferase
MEQYLQIRIDVLEEQHDALIALLFAAGFDSFNEDENFIDAYILENQFDAVQLETLLKSFGLTGAFKKDLLENKNWNEEWEKNFEPIIVDDKCYVRATFHPLEPQYPFEIIINPKMSFGTGHHATTYMMMQFILELNLEEKTIIDAGCGTGILSVLVEKKKAKSVIAFDIEDWAFENLNENCKLNECNCIKTSQGTIAQVVSKEEVVDVLLANINKNVLLDEMHIYANHVKENGDLILSGFYDYDESDIDLEASKNGFVKQSHKVRNQWMSLHYKKLKK